MNLKIGIAAMRTAWNIILRQEGLTREFVDLNNEIKINDYSVLIINNRISTSKKSNLNTFILNGGAAIICAPIFAEMYDHKIVSEYTKFCVPESDSIFADLGLIDFHTKFGSIDTGRVQFLDSQLKIQFQKIGKGYVLILPFDMNTLILDTEFRRKKFFADRKELPSEIVAKVSKGKIRELAFRCIRFLFDKRKLPLVQKWYYPQDLGNLFMFRVDTDFCTSEQAKALYKLCKKNKIRGTWFVDTDSQSTLKQTYAKMPDQEIALHCRRHIVFSDYNRNDENIRNGISDLKNAGIDVTGFAAPFGEWNENLGQVLEDMDFQYSSEFSLDYDDLPFYPVVKNNQSKVLQIPIHPISSNRLNRSHFSDKEKWEYYKTYIDDCVKTCKPIFLYHHPSHGEIFLFDKIFKYINRRKIRSLTYREYSDWWSKRYDLNLEFKYSGSSISCNSDTHPDDIYLRISKNDKYVFTKISNPIKLNELGWKSKVKLDLKTNLSRIRKWHWRDALYNYESKKGRRNK